jgi:outer membrane immunogenic protein
VDPKWVVGLEADIQGTGERSSVALTVVGPRFGAFANGLPNPLPGPDFNAIAALSTSLL